MAELDLTLIDDQGMHTNLKEFRKVAGNTRSAVPAFLLGKGPDRQMHTLVDAYCPEPGCRGGEVSIRLFPERGAAPPVSFRLDLFEGTGKMPADMPEPVKGIAMDFASAHWDLLARRRQIVRAWGLLKLRRRQGYVPGDTFSFQDFQARVDHWVIPFQHAGRRWVALDASCVNPDCTCTDVQIHILDEGKVAKDARPEFLALLDLETGTIRGVDDTPLVVDRLAVIESFLESLGDWKGELTLRRDLLRKIARKRLRVSYEDPEQDPEEATSPPAPSMETFEPEPSSETTIVNESPRPGRNDPCPCGSGKKFKKCCGR